MTPAPESPAAPLTPIPPALFERLGGQPGIQKLLRHFYADVRQHAVLGPIFNTHIHDWPAHLEKIGQFWARQTGGPSTYAGGFGAAHLKLQIDHTHLQNWLALWEFNCRRHLAADEAAEMIALAHRIGSQLLRLLAGRGGLTIGPS